MATTVMEMRLDEMTLLHRWLALVQPQHPTIPQPLLECYASCAGDPSLEALAEAVPCTVDNAGAWGKLLDASLLAPDVYRDLFAAEDALADRRGQWQRYQDDARATSHRLADLQREIEAAKAYQHTLLDPEEQAALTTKIADLDQARVDLLRHQGDLPGIGALIQQALTEAQMALAEAETALRDVQEAHLQATEAAWLREALAAVEPVCALLLQARWLDAAWQRLGEQPNREHGTGHIRERLLQALRA